MKLTIISDKGSPMMVIQKINRKGDMLEVTGQMMGAWPAKMYITSEEFWNLIRVTLTPSVILYVLLYPFFCLSRLFKHKR